jgi:hypothetical protein
VGRYVPVVIETGGDIGEATDHILSTKLLCKIRDRHDARPEDFLELRETLLSAWRQLGGKSEPSRSLDVIRHELHRLGHEED